jgi:hypothetical protein
VWVTTLIPPPLTCSCAPPLSWPIPNRCPFPFPLPAYAEGQYNYGNLMLQLGAAPAAKHLYELALQLNPQHAKAGKNLEIATASIKDEGRE